MKKILFFLLISLYAFAQQPGDLDLTFGALGTLADPDFGSGNAIAIQSDNKIVVTAGSFGIKRYLPNGATDTGFGSNGITTIPIGINDLVNDVLVQPNGKIIMVGYSDNGSNQKDFAIVRLNQNGTLDTSFNGIGILQIAFGTQEDQAKAVILQADGKIIVTGFSFIGTNKDVAIVRINTNGTLDTSFSSDGKHTIDVLGGNDVGNGLAIQTNGAIVIASTSFPSSTPTISSFAAIRLLSDGILDSSFNGTGSISAKIGIGNDNAEAIQIQSDGKIIIGGNSYMSATLKEDFSVVRFTSEGILDTSFSGDGKFSISITSNDYGNCMRLQVDGKILIGGYAVIGSTASYLVLVRLTASGSLDSSFVGTGKIVNQINGYVGSDLGVQSSGRIVQIGYTSAGLIMKRFYGIPNCSGALTGLNANNIQPNSANIGWTIPVSPPQSYDYCYSLVNTTPSSTEEIAGNVLVANGSTATLNGLSSNTQYYYWVRSNCGSDSIGSWILGGSFTTTSNIVCTNGNLNSISIFQPSCNNSFEIISSNALTGEYSNISSSTNKTYTFKTDVATDYITITNNSGSLVYANGLTPITWNSGNASETIRYYIHANNNCALDTYIRTKSMKCTNYVCSDPTSLSATNISSYNAIINWVVTTTPALGFEYFFNTSNTQPSINTVASGTSINLNIVLSGLLPTTTYYYWVRSKCSSILANNWISGGSFLTANFNGCNTGSIENFSPYTLTCSGNFESMLAVKAGGYNTVNLTSNKNYVFRSAVSSDFITITNNSNNAVLAYGTSPLSWSSSSFSGTARFYIHTNSSCGTQNLYRNISVKCDSNFCTEPLALLPTNTTNTAVQLNWTSIILPTNGFQFYISSANIIPEYNANPSGTTNALFVIATNLTSATTYYSWIRSVCDVNSISNWIPAGSFTTTSLAACGNGVLWPTNSFTPACTGSIETINSDAVAGQYAIVNSSKNKLYTFSSSTNTDYISITNEAGTSILAQGISPVYWNSGPNTGIIRYYLHVNATCTTDTTIRTRNITCNMLCAEPSNGLVSGINTNSATISWSSDSSATSSQIYYSTSNTSPITSTVPSIVSIPGTTTLVAGLVVSTTYYYWIRSFCSLANSSSNWVYGGSFITASNFATCNFGVLKPEMNYTPSCTGENESINTDAFAGEYSIVNVLLNKQYSFSSSNPSDYITIWSNDLTNQLASGTTPLVWNSTGYYGQIKYFIFSNSSCGSENVARSRFIKCAIAQCNVPSNIVYSEATINSIKVNFTSPSQNPLNGYDYYFTTINTPPSPTSIPSGNYVSASTGNLSMVLFPPNAIAGTTYYFWMRSSCDANSKSDWVYGGSFATLSNIGCTTGYLYPLSNVFTPSCSGNQEIINANTYSGRYCRVNSIANTQYTFSSSVTTDYVTITNQDGSITYAYGPTPLIWESGIKSDIIRYYLHADAACGVDGINRTRYISCGTSIVCNTESNLNASNISFSNITRTTASFSWSASSSSLNYLYYLSTNNTTPTIGTSPSGLITAGSLVFNLSGLTFNTTYYLWMRSDCGGLSNWVLGGSFVTLSGCIDGTLYPAATYTPVCPSSLQAIVTNAYAGEYSKINISAANQYTFSSSVYSDYVTITNETGTIVYADGPSPLLWNSNSTTGTIRYYLHTNNTLCGVQSTSRTRFIACNASNCNVIAPTASNQSLCSGARISNLVATGSNLRWYSVATGGTPLVSTSFLFTGTYFVSQVVGSCESITRTAVSVSISSSQIPVFTAVTPVCSGASLSALPTTSTNGITGTWSPALNNTATTTYTFTPTTGQCATTKTLTITVITNVVPAFSLVAPICSGASLSALPTTSTNGITGTWSPALNNMGTTTYTFTPTTGQCATPTTLTITVNSLPLVDTLANITSCVTYTLPPLIQGNYFTGSNATGAMLTAGSVITQSATIYIFNQNTSCTAESNFMITITPIDVTTSLNNATISANQMGATYQWLDCDNGNAIIAGATSQSYTATINSHYAVRITLGICQIVSNCVTINSLANIGFDESNAISIYPNPSQGNFTVETASEIADSLLVFDSLGRFILNKKPNANKTIIDMSIYTDGVYYVKIKRGSKLSTKKLILFKN